MGLIEFIHQTAMQSYFGRITQMESFYGKGGKTRKSSEEKNESSGKLIDWAAAFSFPLFLGIKKISFLAVIEMELHFLFRSEYMLLSVGV